MTERAGPKLTMTEAQYQGRIVEAAGYLGYDVYHTRFSLGSQPGWPDLILVRPGRMLAIEVKSERGQLTPAQAHWLHLLATVPGVRTLLARPSNWDAVEDVLTEVGQDGVYVDELRRYPRPVGASRRYTGAGEVWAHLTADSPAELLAFARRLGLSASWARHRHYDLTPGMRARAVRLGAIETTARERLRQIQEAGQDG